MDAEISWRSHASFHPTFAAQLRLHQVQMVSAANFCIVRTELSTLCLEKAAPCLLAAFNSTLPFDSKSAVCRLALRHLSWRPQHPHILRGPHPRPSPLSGAAQPHGMCPLRCALWNRHLVRGGRAPPSAACVPAAASF